MWRFVYKKKSARLKTTSPSPFLYESGGSAVGFRSLSEECCGSVWVCKQPSDPHCDSKADPDLMWTRCLLTWIYRTAASLHVEPPFFVMFVGFMPWGRVEAAQRDPHPVLDSRGRRWADLASSEILMVFTASLKFMMVVFVIWSLQNVPFFEWGGWWWFEAPQHISDSISSGRNTSVHRLTTSLSWCSKHRVSPLKW